MIAEARIALERIGSSEQLVVPQMMGRFMANLTALSQVKTRDEIADHTSAVITSVEQMYGIATPTERSKPFVFNEGMAIIPVHGVLMNRFSGCWGFATGYNFIRAQMNAADADDDVSLIVFDVNSPGGDAAGCFELTADIRALGTKTIAVVDDLAASGGYAIAAAPNKMVCTPSGSVGSIGVYRMHIDVSGAMTQEGVKYTFVFSGEHKVDGNPFEPLPDSVREDWQRQVDVRREEFVADVAISRDLDPDDVRNTEARMYRADEALALGLLDAVDTPTHAVSAFLAELADDEGTDDEDDEMTEAEINAKIEAARAEGVASVKVPDSASILAADRERRTKITSLDEAKDRPKLAATLADTDGMTDTTAKVILASAAIETKVEGKPLDKAMDASGGGAGVGVEGDPVGGGSADEPGKRTDAQISEGLLAHIPAARRLTVVK